MNKRLTIIALCSFGCFFNFSCKKNKINDIDQQNYGETTRIIAKRPGNGEFKIADEELLLRWEPKNKHGKISVLTVVNPIGLSDYLGRAYSLNEGEFGSAEQVKLPVLDVSKFAIDNPDLVSSLFIGQSTATSFGYSSFDRYKTTSKKITKINGGFKLNFGLFSIGAKNSFINTFTSLSEDIENRVYGQLDVTIKDSSYEMTITSNLEDALREKYLRQSFIDNLYNLPTSEVMQKYGGVVITGFYSGGRATATFTGKSLENNTEETKEKNMENSINASFVFKPKQKEANTAEFSLGNTQASTTARNNKIGSFMTSMKTYGGGYGSPSFTVPKSVDQVNVDFGPWTTSMNDKSKHVLIDFKENGLLPLHTLAEGDNIQYIIKESYEKILPLKPLMVPRLEGRYWRYPQGNGGASIAMMLLRTRFGDEIALKMDKFSNLTGLNNNVYLDKFTREEGLEIQKKFKLDLVSVDYNDPSTKIGPIYRLLYLGTQDTTGQYELS
jgi:hypothetical protein